jgi:hypothetical protein
MADFGPDLYGQPCRECGFSWDIAAPDAAALIADAPARYRELTQGFEGSEQPPGASWTVAGYVAHVADNVRIWAERLAGLARGDGRVVPYDQDALAEVRSYRALPLVAVLFSFERAAADWAAIWDEVADRDDLVLEHPEMGAQPMRGVIALVAHDVAHHAWDVGRVRRP